MMFLREHSVQYHIFIVNIHTCSSMCSVRGNPARIFFTNKCYGVYVCRKKPPVGGGEGSFWISSLISESGKKWTSRNASTQIEFFVGWI